MNEIENLAKGLRAIAKEKFDVLNGLYDMIDALNFAAGQLEKLSEKPQAANMDNGSGWISADEPPKDRKEVLVFNGKSYSVGYYNGKEWVNAIHPVKWKLIEP